MKAAVFVGAGSPLELRELPDPEPGPGEVVLRVEYCGVCASDLSYTVAGAFGYPENFVAGHEIGATVAAIGPGVESLRIGDKVSPYPNRGCGRCADCLEGRPYFCPEMEMNMGGFGQYMKTPAIACARLPDKLSLADAALIEPLAVGLMGAEAAGPLADARVLVLGAGPIGLSATYWAHRLGAKRVVTAARSRRHEAIAGAMGADRFLTIDDDFAGAAREHLGGPADVVIEAVGRRGTLDIACELVKPRATISILGLCQEPDTVNLGIALLKGLDLKFVLGTSAREFTAVAHDLDSGNLVPRAMVTDTISLAELPESFEELRKPSQQCKILVSPWGE